MLSLSMERTEFASDRREATKVTFHKMMGKGRKEPDIICFEISPRENFPNLFK
jgi:hypothetical protein